VVSGLKDAMKQVSGGVLVTCSLLLFAMLVSATQFPLGWAESTVD
jgi:hypothetical protein